MSKPCSEDPNNVDSDYYVYSIQGFDPCHKFDFNRSYTIKFRLQCQMVDKDGYLEPEPPKEELGYKYEDVISIKQTEATDYEYLVDDKKTGMVLSKGTELTMNFDFRDWKYLSNMIRSTLRVTDVDLMLGETEGEIDVDFSQIV